MELVVLDDIFEHGLYMEGDYKLEWTNMDVT
jgi:hypothetical protein